MEQGWARQEAFHVLNVAEIQEILVPAGLVIARAEPIQEGLANSNYKLTTDDGKLLVFRVCQGGLASKPLQIAITRRLEKMLPVPKVVEELPETPYMVFSWLPGQTMQTLQAEDRYEEILEAAPSIGQSLAKLANRKYGHCGFLNPKLKVVEPWGNLYHAYQNYLETHGRDAYLKGKLSLEMLMDVIRSWERYRPALEKVMDQPCLSHGDFKASNLLIANGKLSGVLDWEFVHAGTWLLDAGQALRYMGERRDVFAIAMEQGMRAGKMDLPDDWPLLARTVDLMNLVDFANRPKINKAQLNQVTGLIEESLAALT